MHLTTVLLGCLLLGQAPLTAPESSAAPQQAPAAFSPPQLVAEALTLPPESKLSGQPLSLLKALSAALDRRGQIDVAHAYWRLVRAVAMYRFAVDQQDQLQRLQAPTAEAALLRAAQASAAASLEQAEVEVVAAQHELAALMLLPPEAPLPLPADRPHVGPYLTHFQALFSTRIAPARAKLMDRILPIRRGAIEQRALAVQAAQEAVAAAVKNRDELASVLARMGESLRQQQEFIESACRYNDDIAEYAFSVAGPGTSVQTLVRMLIKPAADATVQSAAHNESAPTTPARPEGRAPVPSGRQGKADQNAAAPAPPSRLPPVSKGKQEAPAPDSGWAPSGRKGSTAAPTGEEESVAPEGTQPAGPPAPEDIGPEASAKSARAIVPVEPPTPTTLHKLPGEPQAESPLMAAGDPLYPALAAVTPAERAKKLTAALQQDRALPEGIGEPISLQDCLGRQTSGDRYGLIKAYWLARQAASEYQVLAQKAQWLQGLAMRETKSSRLRSAELTTKAAVEEAQAALIEAQFELAAHIGRVSAPLWPIPSTAPHSGKYLLKFDKQPRQLVESWPLRHTAAMIPGLTKAVQERAAAVVEADGVRAAAAASYQAGGQSVEQLLEGIDRQTDQALAFLQALTDYNLAIADYALTVLPPQMPSNRLAAALVVVR
jgi:hypothetical protein